MISSHSIIINSSPVCYWSGIWSNNHTILVLHGRWWSSASRKKVLEWYVSLGYSVFVPDLPGFGNTPLPYPFAIEDYARRVQQFIDQISIPSHHKITILWHSNGGRIAVYAIIQHIIRCDSLILNNAAGIPIPPKRWARIFAYPKKLVFWWWKYILSCFPFVSKIREYFYRFLGWHDYLEAEKNPILKETFLNMLKTTYSDDVYAQIKVPTLVLWWEYDTYTPLRMGQKISLLVPHSTFVLCSGQKHGIHLTDPNRIVNETNDFILQNF